jgi:DNA-binding CsgD family transcriptional regulator
MTTALGSLAAADVGGAWHHELMRSPVASPAMVGRDADLAMLHDEFTQSVSGPRAVAIGGEAGIGKTRLVSEFAATVASDATVLVGRSVELGPDGAPYSVYSGVLRDLLTAIGRDALLAAAGPSAAVLSVLVPELDDAHEPSRRTGAERLYEVVAVLLENVARERPLVIVLEDMHWADSGSLELTRFLVRMLDGTGILLVMTFRSDEVLRGHPARAMLTELERTRRLHRHQVARLSRADVAAQVDAIRGERASASDIDLLYERSEGVPFFVEEFLCAEVDGLQLTETLRDVLLAGYERLSEPVQLLLRLIATGGSYVPHELLSAVFSGDPDDLDARLREALDAGILLVDGNAYCFRHALVRDAIADDVLPGERTRFHVRYAEAFEAAAARGEAVASEISFHRLAAHDPVRAFPATLEAMEQALDAYARGTAAAMGERALELWDQVPDAPEVAGRSRLDLMAATADARRDSGDGERALALIDAALAECDDADVLMHARLSRSKALYLASMARTGSTALLEEALAAVPVDDTTVRPALVGDLAGRYMLEARFTESIALATQSFELAQTAGSISRSSVALNIRGVSKVGSGDIEAGLADLERAGELARAQGSGMREGAMLRYRVNASDVMHLLGRFDEAVHIGNTGVARARELGVERTSGVMLMSNTVEPLLALGQWERARGLLDPALALDASPGFRGHLQRMKLWLTLWSGDVAGAADLLGQWRTNLSVLGAIEAQSQRGAARVFAEIALAQGQLDEAWRALGILLDERRPPLPAYDLPLLVVAARVLAGLRADPDSAARAGLDDHVAAEQRLRTVAAALSQWPTAGVWLPVFDAELSGSTGVGDDVGAWRAAATSTDRERFPQAPVHLAPYAYQRLAAAQLAASDRSGAEESVRVARELAAGIGCGLVLDALDRLVERGGLSRGGDGAVRGGDRPQSSSGLRLTEREAQVLDLMGQGLSNKQIGERLFISAKTASVHVSAILRKLGATSRTEAVYLASRSTVDA